MTADLVRSLIREIPDFPKPGILFRDITPVLDSPEAFRAVIDRWSEDYLESDIHLIVGIESRGFLFGAPLAYKMGLPFVPVRKPGKLPGDTVSVVYELEYGTDRVEIHRDAIREGQRVLVVDDLLATGGTMEAACRLVEEVGGTVAGVACLIELTELGGREKLGGRDIAVLVSY
jgi:adenine phosphoribosyltransferase